MKGDRKSLRLVARKLIEKAEDARKARKTRISITKQVESTLSELAQQLENLGGDVKKSNDSDAENIGKSDSSPEGL